VTRGAFAALALASILSACSARPEHGAVPTITRTPVPTATLDLPDEPTPSYARTDTQGAVEFVVEPLNLDGPEDTIDFSVSMNTHSVDVGWDLAALSTLETDDGQEVQATMWPVGSGHHYAGTLSFPRVTSDGENLLDGAGNLRLVIRDTDVPERVFTWNIAP
jgi:hypothetical protein